jgi:hypothetical protein
LFILAAASLAVLQTGARVRTIFAVAQSHEIVRMPITRILPNTDDRVSRHTSPSVNRRLRRSTLESLQRFAGADRMAIDARIDELRAEWDIERTLEANAAAIALTGVILGVTVDRRWLLLPAVVTGFLLQHALQGWCPPLPLFRRLGVRTAAEIHEEMFALRVLRGDFGPPPDADAALDRASLTH